MRIALITDAWAPQVNGVVRTLQAITELLARWGHEVLVISPDQYRSVPCPSYPEIRLALASGRSVGKRIECFAPDAVHVATEGPLGLAARNHCVARGVPFTTAYHTHFPDYVAKRTGLPASWFWSYIRWFHGPSAGIMVATESVRRDLRAHGLPNLREWSRGVDLEAFGPQVAPPDLYWDLPRPIQLYVGRVAVEKNIEAFLKSDVPGSKVVVGDGPALARLRQEFPEAHFLGRQMGAELAACYAGADVFVFPSRTDTFGLVMIEALACGTPVAAYPVTGPVDILTPESGAMDENLSAAITQALTLDREGCLAHGRSFTWDASARQFLDALVCPAEPAAEPAAPVLPPAIRRAA
ncbi:glycosyltransferase family 1 protein [Erythrobacter sp. SG61-1L]|uniref:glycosyltransferase family 4 protein n=1 Tax=Erythrobacter sp. SG61-1L TaxID=1603897 RepID=UPI0006C92C95|nr:glycosyltransferase family 1 protein [Erythrobacter sp. SG61-1L]